VLLFAATLFLSSLLMFALEPIVAKTVLPILGGTPMVWNTCVLFFQILLLGGYAYAHGATKWLGPRLSGAAYAVVLVLPFATLPFGIGPDVQPPAGSNPIGWLLLALGWCRLKLSLNNDVGSTNGAGQRVTQGLNCSSFCSLAAIDSASRRVGNLPTRTR
jgi:hypothetical protein